MVIECGPLTTLTPEFQARLADEIDAAGPNSAVAELVRVYGMDRDEIRACIEASR